MRHIFLLDKVGMHMRDNPVIDDIFSRSHLTSAKTKYISRKKK